MSDLPESGRDWAIYELGASGLMFDAQSTRMTRSCPGPASQRATREWRL